MKAEVKGTTMPVLEMFLDPGEYIVSTHGDLSWMSTNIQLSQTMQQGNQQGGGGLLGTLKRVVGGGGLFLTRYEAMGGQGMVAFASKLPGRIFPIEVTPQMGVTVHKKGWVCGTPGIVSGMAFQQNFRSMVYGGEGFVLQKLEGQGTAWVELGGEITTYDLGPGQSLYVHPGHVGMFHNSVSFTIQRMQGIMNRFFGQDGAHLAVLTGPGTIWLQSLPIVLLAHEIGEYIGGDRTDTAAAGVGGGLLGGMIGRNL